jgi:drug/metabolite transporter (DMT)-like permease
MHTWILYSVLASLLWAFVNISDQYLVAKYATGERGSGGLVLFSSLIGIVIASAIGVAIPHIFDISSLDKVLLLLSGGLTIAWVILYLYSLELTDVSLVVPWFLTVPVFGYVLGYIFLGEILTNYQLLGSLITIIGLAILQINFKFNSLKDSVKIKPIFYMLTACLIIAVQGIMFKYVALADNFWVSSFWQYVGLGLVGLVLCLCLPKHREQFMEMNKDGGKEILTLNVLSELTSVTGNLLSNFATLLAPVTLVYLFGSFQPVFVLVLSILGTIFFPHIVKEDISLHSVLPKVVALGIMILGSLFLFN